MFRFILQFSFKLNRINNAALSIPQSPFSTAISKSPNSSTNYLINSLGLSNLPQHKQINLKCTAKPDSVLALFKTYGFSNTDMATVFNKYPTLLLADPIKNMKPKLDFFSQNGFSGQLLVRFLTVDPIILRRSLDNRIIPCFNFLTTFYGSNGDSNNKIVSLLMSKRGNWILYKFSEHVEPNIATLRSYGVPDLNIEKMMAVRPGTLAWNRNEFSMIVRKIVEMGFDTQGMMFIHGVGTLAGMKREKWDSKFESIKSFGWTEEQIRLLFVKQPKVLCASGDKLKRMLDFFMNRLEWGVDEILIYPTLLIASIEKLKMRFSIFEVLNKRGIVKKRSIARLLSMPDHRFLKEFLLKYQFMVPEILEIYQSKAYRTVSFPKVACST